MSQGADYGISDSSSGTTGRVRLMSEDVTAHWLTPTDVSRWSSDLVRAERFSRHLWKEFADRDKAGIVCLLREQLLRLLMDPSWIEGSLRGPAGALPRDGDRLDVTITLHLDEVNAAILRTFHEREQELEESLRAIAARLSDPS